MLSNLVLDFMEGEDSVKANLVRRFHLDESDISCFRIIRKSLDARKKGSIRYAWTVEFCVPDEEVFFGKFGGDPHIRRVAKTEPGVFPRIGSTKKIVIAGMGPAGLFAALRLSEYGLTATVAERGTPVDERLRDVQAFWSRGDLDPESNVQFGEGGAGTFSDGKLTTRVRDENLRYVLEKFVRFGAPEDIIYLGKPHIGTDRLRHIVREMRKSLEKSGFEILFRHKLTDLACSRENLSAVVLNDSREIPCDYLILAPGHSARDTYEMLLRRSVAIERKPFAIGLRVEHPQELINRIQFGTAGHPGLPAADYSLTYNNPRTGRSVYSFCMCPGGVVVAGASEQGMVVTNGMSNYMRNAPFANSALVVPVGVKDFPGDGPLAGVEFQRHWERRAFHAGGGGYHAPVQNLLFFLGKGKAGRATSTYRPGFREADLSETLPGYVTETIREGISYFDRKMRGFVTSEATLTGVETRTSAPVTILRDSDMQSVSVRGLFPVGEGAGYAGGIVSAALDGIRAADCIARLIMESGRSMF